MSLAGVFYPFNYILHLHCGRVESPPRSCYIFTAVVLHLHRGRVVSPPRSCCIITAVVLCHYRGRVRRFARFCCKTCVVVLRHYTVVVMCRYSRQTSRFFVVKSPVSSSFLHILHNNYGFLLVMVCFSL